MISFKHRFHGHTGLNFVYQQGKTVRDPRCTLKYATNNRQKTYRLAVVVSKKISKKAVVRNRIRRRIYEIVRQREAHINQPFDMVLTVFDEGLMTESQHELETLILRLLTAAHIVS
jgi:ribonuclease P protein component